jgi:hypothetical protein
MFCGMARNAPGNSPNASSYLVGEARTRSLALWGRLRASVYVAEAAAVVGEECRRHTWRPSFMGNRPAIALVAQRSRAFSQLIGRTTGRYTSAVRAWTVLAFIDERFWGPRCTPRPLVLLSPTCRDARVDDTASAPGVLVNYPAPR